MLFPMLSFARQICCIRTSLGGLVVGCLTVASWAQSPTANPPAAATAPTPAAKAQRILILGDSLMAGLAFSLEGELAKHPGVVTRSCAKLGTGLARLDLYNWPQEISEQTKAFKPDTAVVWMGGNDSQPLKTLNGILQQPGTPEWATEYARRMGLVMDSLIGGGIQRVYWMELPDMRDDKFQADVAIIRDIQAKAAKLRLEVSVLPIRNLLSPTPGKYRKYILDNGLPLNVRADDGAHLNQTGYKYVAAKIAPTILW